MRYSMRILTSKYWNKFKKIKYTKDGKKYIVKDGKKFEDLIKVILDLEYGENRWKETGKSWDGSRDFEWKSNDWYRWAECKNYESNISLNVISNTLIMAMIEYADEVLIFSYSKIKKPVLNKLIQFANVSKKILRIYADESLEELILKHMDQLKKEFFPRFDPVACTESVHLSPYIACNIISDPIRAYTLNEDITGIPHKPDAINVNSILCIDICVWNQTNKDTDISVALDWREAEGHFLVLSSLNKNQVCFKALANSTNVKKIYIQCIVYKKRLPLPNVVVSCGRANTVFSFGYVKCSWVGECSLQGTSYKKCIKEFSSKILNSKFYRAINIYGTSGTGKSRLLQECENIALGKEYRVIEIKYSSSYSGREENEISQKIIIEFICAVYDIPNLEECLTQQTTNAMSDTLEMIAMLKKNKLAPNYLSDVVIPTITKKLLETQCFIAFDNVQFYPILFIKFLYDLNNNLMLTNNKLCKCRMGFTFNTDYIYYQADCIDFYTSLIRNKEILINVKCEGFANDNEARVFLNQLLPNLNVENNYINDIIKSSNRIPFFLQTYCKLLEDEGILEQRSDCYVIPQHMKTTFREKILQIPATMRGVIKERWKFFLKTNSKAECLNAISIMHIFQQLDIEKIEQFELSQTLIKDLVKHHIFKEVVNQEIIYYFEHDFIEKFFSEEYFPLCQYAFKKNSVPPQISHYWYSKISDVVYEKVVCPKILSQIVQKDIPYKIGLEFYTILTNLLISKMGTEDDIKKYLGIIEQICANVREMYGTKSAISLYNKLVNKIELDFPLYQANDDWAWLMVTYCNLLYEDNLYTKAIENMKNLLWYWTELKICCENIKIYCYLYNRLHVYNRAMSKNVTRKSLIWLEKSEKLQVNAEEQFLNLIDRGYCNCKDESTKENLLMYWNKACDVYEKNSILSKKLNYYYAKMRMHLFSGDLKQADNIINLGLGAIETKEEGTYYFSYFRQRYIICKIALLLVTSTYNNLSIVSELINEAENIDFILKGRTAYVIYWLKSNFLLAKYQYADSLLCLQSSIEKLVESKKQTFQNIYLNQIYDNARYLIAQSLLNEDSKTTVQILSNTKLISIFKEMQQMDIDGRKNFIQNHKATSILQTNDHKINFPVL